MTYFISDNLLSPCQYGKALDEEIQHATVQLILPKKILQFFDQGIYVVSSFLDLSKAFVAVNHHSLLNKGRCYKLPDSEISWFRS